MFSEKKSSLQRIEKQPFQALINSIYLPRRLLVTVEKSIQEIGGNYLQLICDELEEFKFTGSVEETNGFSEIQLSFKTWLELQKDFFFQSERVHAFMKILKSNELDCLPIYFASQNSCMLIQKNNDASIEHPFVVSVFQTQFQRKEILKADGDCVCQFPFASYYVANTNFLFSTSFSLLVQELCNKTFDISSVKKGSKVREEGEAENPRLIHEYLMALLAGDVVQQDNSKGTPRIIKKIRDEVLINLTKIPFRRSPMWLAVKVVLNLLLKRYFKEDEAQVIYKLMILNIHIRLAEATIDLTVLEVSDDTWSHILSKTARRIYKLQNDSSLSKFTMLKKKMDETVFKAHSIFDKRTDLFNTLSTEKRKKYREKKSITGHEEPSEQDTVHDFAFKKTIENLKESINIQKVIPRKAASENKMTQRNLIQNNQLAIENLKQHSDSLQILALHDIESLLDCKGDEYFWSMGINQLRILFKEYMRVALIQYKNNPVAISRMVMALLQLLIIIDKCTLLKFPMMKDHRFGVNEAVLELLLAPNSQDIERVKIISDYIHRRNVSKYPSLIEESQVSNNSFAERFSQGNAEIARLLKKIETVAAQKISEKKKEVINKCNEYTMLMEQYYRLTCSIVSVWNNERSKFDYMHDIKCPKCNLYHWASNISVQAYELPLPDKEIEKHAVIFELLIPDEISFLRDSLFSFRNFIYGKNFQSIETCNIKGQWSNTDTLCSEARGNQRLVNLASTTKLFKESYIGKNIKYLSLDQLIVPNGFEVVYMDVINGLPVKEMDMEMVDRSQFFFNIPKNSIYNCLQWTLQGTSHTENEVIAKQKLCPMGFDLREFIKFGSFRAGAFLQHKNLAEALGSKALSFERTEVFLLIRQALFSLESINFDNLHSLDWMPCHFDFTDSNFLESFFPLIEEYLQTLKENWKMILVIHLMSEILRKIISLNRSNRILETALRLLKMCRTNLISLLKTVEELKSDNTNSEFLTRMKLKILELSTYLILTFHVGRDRVKEVLNTEEDVFTWITSMKNIYENSDFVSQDSLKLFLSNLITHEVSLCLHESEELLNDIIVSTRFKVLGEIVKNYLPEFQIEQDLSDWEVTGNEFSYKYVIEKKGKIIDVSLKGEFLVNHQPATILPKSITDSEDFQRIFKNQIFTAHFDGTDKFSAIYTKGKLGYNFHLKDKLVIEEIRTDDKERYYLYIPPRTFNENVPKLLREKYSHWLDVETNIIELRPVYFGDYTKNDSLQIFYKMDLNKGVIWEVNSFCEKLLVNNEAKIFMRIIHSGFGFMDQKQYIHIWQVKTFKSDEKVGPRKSVSKGKLENCDEPEAEFDLEYVVHIPRFSLSFSERITAGNTNFFWESVEYEGMILDDCQKIGSLYGLEQGIVLKQKHASNRKILIIPHGKLCQEKEAVVIETENIYSPPYFTYEIDRNLKQLKGETTTAWIYLAALHACTSKSYVDELTGITGAEMAIYLLQSARCWSCEPYPDEALEVLSFFVSLSPKRKFYPQKMKVMQRVNWNIYVGCRSCSDAYVLICNKLIKDSERLNFCYDQKKSKHDADLTLALRGYWKDARYLPPMARLNKEFEDYYGGLPETTLIFCETNYISNVSNITTFAQAMVSGKVKYATEIDFGFLLKNPMLLGLDPKRVSPKNFTLTDWIMVDQFKDMWLNLFQFVVNCDNEGIYTIVPLLAFSVYANQITFDQAMNLVALAMNKELFLDIPIPQHSNYECPEKILMTLEEIKAILVENSYPMYEFVKRKQLEKTETEINSLIEKIKESAEKQLNIKKKSIKNGFKGCLEDFYYKNNEYYDEFMLKSSENLDKLSFDLLKLYEQRKLCDKLVTPFIDCTVCLKSINDAFELYWKNNDLKDFLSKVQSSYQSINRQEGQKVNFLHEKPQVPIKAPQEIKLIIDYDSAIQAALDLEECLGLGKTIISLMQEEDSRIQHDESAFSNSSAKPFPLEISSLNCENKEIMNVIEEDLKMSWEYHQKFGTKQQEIKRYQTNTLDLIKEQKKIFEKSLQLEKKLKSAWEISDAHLLVQSGLWPRFVPSNYLEFLTNKSTKCHQSLKEAIISLLLCWIYSQKIERVLILKQSLNHSVGLEREAGNPGHTNWNVLAHPEWVLMEYEMDMIIREVQIQITMAMIKPEEDRNTVMQLNMGEGKTAMIVPLLCVALADGSKLVQVTVLKSLFRMNKHTLVNKLAGNLNRRIYVIPFKRDFTFTKQDISNIKTLLMECQEKQGVLLTLPEYKLSFNLKGLDLISQKNYELANHFLGIRNYLEANVREILDESDEILSVKYQLIYTIGKQDKVEEIRWIVPEVILELGKAHFEKILSEYGEDCFELIINEKGKISFPHVRLLNRTPYKKLCKLICSDILKGEAAPQLPINNLKTEERELIEGFILSEQLSDVFSLDKVRAIFGGNGRAVETVVLLRGLFTHDIFFNVLSKRWRVNYGARTRMKNEELFQAVPYRAKDIPAEKAQFGHTDITIFLTILNYYYSGLDDEKLDHVFDQLSKTQNKIEVQSIYDDWIKYFSKYGYNAEEGLQKFESINIEDSVQRRKLYESLRYHPRVIDYWLNKILFPREAKEFCLKIGTSTWDLCPTKKGTIMTGFSGTNDTRMLLPLNTFYQEVAHLKGTNGLLISNLVYSKRPSDYKKLEANTNALAIIENLVKNKIKLLIDVGALMIEFENSKVAKEWLERDKEAEAALYFDPDDNLLVMDREFKLSFFHTSPFKNKLNKCLIYLDDFHTRGTDLKIPDFTVGVVTLGKGLTKDRLMQACMRMRQLGRTHFVSFWASHEAHISIVKHKESLKQDKDSITAKDVIEWTIRNTRDFISDGFVFWSNQGLSFYRRVQAFAKLDQVNLDALLSLCMERDNKSIERLYVNNREEQTIPKIFEEKSNHFNKHIVLKDKSVFFDGSNRILERLNSLVPHVKKFGHSLDEEQEIELEIEIEVEDERELERPKIAAPHKPFLAKEIKNLVNDSIECPKSSNSYVKMTEAFHETLIERSFLPSKEWEMSCNFFVTQDFLKTIESGGWKDEFLRPPKWLARVIIPEAKGIQKEIYLFLSAYEANELLKLSPKNRDKIYLITSRVRFGQNYPLIQPKLGWNSKSDVFSHVFFFSGSMFFNSEEEQSQVLEFFGLYPHPRSPIEEALFQKELINKDSFIEENNLEAASKILKTKIPFNFAKNPGDFFKKLCILRNYNKVPNKAHHHIVINAGKKVEFCPVQKMNV